MAKEYKGLWIPKEILQDLKLSTTGKMVLALIQVMSIDGKCIACNKTIAESLGTSIKTVEKAVPQLERGGYITTKKYRDEKKIIHRIIYLPPKRGQVL